MFSYFNMEQQTQSSLMHEFKQSKKRSAFPAKIGMYFLTVVLLGIGTGYLLAGSTSNPRATTNDPSVEDYKVAKGQTFGSDDTDSFQDVAEGELEEGGIEGEGAYHLVRPGGESQNVYLTSSDVDLSQLVGRKIKVWGNTQTAQHAGWLMDVGRVEVL